MAEEEPVSVFVRIIIGILETTLVLTIVVGAVAVIWNATKTSPQDQDFKRVLDAADRLINSFEDGKIRSTAEFKVPIVSEDVLQIMFYPAKTAAMPPRCKERTCVCMYYVVADNKKETCKIIETKDNCKPETCGEELCAGSYSDMVAKKGDSVRVAIGCTNQGSQLIIAKA